MTPVLSSALSNLAVNVEELEVYGFETEFDYLFNEHWSISTTAAYAKPEIQEYTKRMCEEGEADGGQLICAGEAGEQLNDEPLLHVFSQLRFTHPLAETGWEFFGILAAEYYDKPYQAVKTPNIKEIMIYDLTLGIADLDGQWTVKFWSRNITDETVLLSESVEEQEIIDPVLGR